MSKSAIATDHAPAAIGPYSQAVKAGKLLFCSGQIALLPDTGEMVSATSRRSTPSTPNNLKGLLQHARPSKCPAYPRVRWSR